MRARAALLLAACALLVAVGAQQPPPPGYGALRAPGTPPFSDGKIIIGGLGINGQAVFLNEFGPLFATYLNAALGAQLNKTFVAAYLDFTTSYTAVAQNQVDFVYVNPSIYACLEAQYGVSAVTSIRTLRASGTPPYAKVPQSVFGANFFALSNRSDINSLTDIAGKRLEGADLTGLGAGQAQWRELRSRNLSFWNLPRAVIFSRNQGKVAGDIAAGRADVGMVRTDLLEGLQATTCAAPSTCFPAGTFKILEPKPRSDGFPFSTSTPLYPEWPVAALKHVDFDTQEAVAAALMALDYRADPLYYTKLAKIATFTPPLPYISLREMQYELGWIVNGSCITSTQTYDTIVCDPGTFRKSAAAVAASCGLAGVPCPTGYDCMCEPCAPVPPVALSVQLAPAAAPGNASGACAKLAVCATAVQTEAVLATLTDNWFGEARAALGVANISSVLFKFHGTTAVADALPWVAAQPSGPGAWSLRLETPVKGFSLLEAMVDGLPLDNSPFVLNIVAPECPGRDASPDDAGRCVCPPSYSLDAAGDCNAPDTSAVNVGGAAGGTVAGVTLLVAVVATAVAIQHRRAEAVWRIPLSSIQFSDPPEVLGRGTFGLVVKGSYRGTTVALKRTLPAAPLRPVRQSEHALRRRSSVRASMRSSQFDMQIDDFGTSSHAGIAAAISMYGNPLHQANASADAPARAVEPQSVDVVVNFAPPPPSPLRGDLVMSRASVADSGVGLASAGVASGTHGIGSAPGVGNGTFGMASGQSSDDAGPFGILHAFRKRRREASLRADFVSEMRLVVHLRHPHITTVLGAVLQRDSDPILVMECMERGSLWDLLHNRTLPLDGDIVLPIIYDVVSGMAFLHAASPPVLHNDLKAANILVDASFRAKVADFGLSGKSRVTGGAPGTPFWMAPELLRGEGNTTATDVYAFGVTLSEVFSRADPYEGEDAAAVLAAVARRPKEGGQPKRPAVASTVSPFFADLMRRCWHSEPAVRPSMAAIAAELKASGHDSNAVSVTAALLAAKNNHIGERELLHAVFPPAVAAALAAGRRVEPRHLDCVTVYFSDIVGFTDISARLPPIKVMRLLERLYTAFDAVTAAHSLFKVETIGDAYMVCGNLVDGQEDDHVARVAAFAADAVAAASRVVVDEDNPAGPRVVVRAGFHCGPVVASVVGQTNPRYCLFGDTVNTASRMESNSLAGRITMSEAAAELLRKQAPTAQLASRGLVAIKGKGSLPLFFLDAPPRVQPWRLARISEAQAPSEQMAT